MLTDIFPKYQAQENEEYHGDKGSTHSYIEIYETILEPYKDNPINFLEVGVAAGLSLQMWRDYFHEKTLIVGCDPNDQWMSEKLKAEFAIVLKYSHVPTTRTILGEITDGEGYDVMIDDGNHDPAVQCATFWNLFPLLKRGGLYIIEDIAAIDQWSDEFKTLHPSCQLYDQRHVKSRGDDVLAVYTK